MMIFERLLESLDACDKVSFSFVQTTLRNSLLDFLMPLVSEKWNWLIPATGLFLYFYVHDKKGSGCLLLSNILLILLVDAVATVLKAEFLRLRPQQVLSEFGMLMQRPASSSFPSNHAANAFAVATSLAFYSPGLASGFFTAASLVAFSRIYLGDHYPLDVLGGAFLGAAFGCAGAGVVQILRRHPGKLQQRSRTYSIPST